MIRPTAQSFADVVSYIVEAWVPKCRCSGSDCCQIRQRMLNYLQRLILIVEFDASRATRFSSFMIPVETITSSGGLDGSRTRVQKPIPCPSTSVVYSLTFPPPHENKHPCGFSSFMIRPQVQSLACVVSHRVEAWILKCECPRSDCCH